MTGRMFTFVGGLTGEWRIMRTDAVIGEPLPEAPRAEVVTSLVASAPQGALWLLRGVTSNERYVTRAERQLLVAKQPAPGRPEAVYAALIPIRKSDAWWELTQDERREIFETRSEHIKTGLRYLPAVARRLHHSRDLGEPFDFLTWFEYAPEHSVAFEELVVSLRVSEEWKYVVREVDIRLVRDVAA
ncbi:MAG: chlorite dismutase family protein [Gammaproteobacteria bacterium]|nr:chlorite dismutase family protein [Gammaproteobacteria bacterium]MCI0591626.1 chlorite dismutase family protein [Gammaproteobacteria bacterium]